ncbi:cysteine--tRNA ligase [Rubrobacter indicoceani]|uniref:cysteine--tRNA ligase n=1 Tax=Rubrobacter indicoceani TaxID=2051957 RepID=UPI000E5BB683|nr:cysteine--tRNA ligase [Rubrobacter indicoceani]
MSKLAAGQALSGVTVRDTLSGGPVTVGKGGKVGLYVCGPTVYNHIHIGNSRVHLFWDVVARYLRSRGYDVKFVWNITDIEDKIIAKAGAEGVTWQEIVRRYTDSFHERLALLNVGLPDVEPKATEHIPEMIQTIKDLVLNGLAYPAENGDVYYAVGSYPAYGELSNQRPSEMRDTEKGDTGFKRSHLDFTLWKASRGDPAEPSWESPWGAGRPGWHIECSAMVSKHLPEGADIHGGGTDIRFPHHENELAQSKGAHPEAEFVRAWCHHGMVRMANTDRVSGEATEKMAKSVGNVVDIKAAVEKFGADAIRMWLLQSHYSQPIDYSEAILSEKKRSWERLLRFYAQVQDATSSSRFSDELAEELTVRFDKAMRDDLNTPEAIAAAFDVTGRAGRAVSDGAERTEFGSLATALGDLLGTLGFDLSAESGMEYDGVRVQGRDALEVGEDILRLAVERRNAREARDFATSDRLRDRLAASGWAVEDTSEGPVLRRR